MNASNQIHLDEKNIYPVIIYLGNWTDEAQQHGNLSECRGRVEAEIAWLRQQRAISSPSIINTIDSLISELIGYANKMPPCEFIPPLPDLSSIADPEYNNRLIRSEADQAVNAIESQLNVIPQDLAEHIMFCIAATKRIPVPDSPIEWHHMFAYGFRGFGRALISKNNDSILTAIKQFQDLGNVASLNAGYDRDEFKKHINAIISLAIPSLSSHQSGGGFGKAFLVEAHRFLIPNAWKAVVAITSSMEQMENIRILSEDNPQ